MIFEPPAVELLKKIVALFPSRLLMLALPAVELSNNAVAPPLKLLIVEFPAFAVPKKKVAPLLS
ncbi:MAG: hypothetical protein ACRD63_11025, partial [Pyrinomonadaceae bacterium]